MRRLRNSVAKFIPDSSGHRPESGDFLLSEYKALGPGLRRGDDGVCCEQPIDTKRPNFPLTTPPLPAPGFFSPSFRIRCVESQAPLL